MFQNCGFFPIAYFFSVKTAFLQISADFVPGFEKFFFLTESSSEEDAIAFAFKMGLKVSFLKRYQQKKYLPFFADENCFTP